MYSERVCGWLYTTIRPDRAMSRPIEIILVAMAGAARCSQRHVRIGLGLLGSSLCDGDA